ncbi:MAG TPA: hypothetical protein VGR31_01900 [Planctomycetota bacterium]|jgi:Tol biopolymer transport system component|nr:hypothetical protein [Planctomycetota bacterium]
MGTRAARIRCIAWSSVWAVHLAFLAPTTSAQVTLRASVSSAGVQGNSLSGFYGLAISADGGSVAFMSYSSNFVAGDVNAAPDIFVRDLQSGVTECVSVASGGALGAAACSSPSISFYGRYAAFSSYSDNLAPGDTNTCLDVFVRDRQLGTTERVSVNSGGGQSNRDCGVNATSISADGRYVAFDSVADNLVAGDVGAWVDVFVHDRQTGVTERVSVDSSGGAGNGDSGTSGLAISADGRCVVFMSSAFSLVPGDTNGSVDVFVHDRQTGVTERVSVDSGGIQGNGDSSYPSISGDGRYVAFSSAASNLVPGDTNSAYDVFVHDRQLGTTERASVDSGGAQGNFASTNPVLSTDGSCVAFLSVANNLVAGDSNGHEDVFVHERLTGATERVSVSSAGVQTNSSSYVPSISADGRYVAFDSLATNLVPLDTNGYGDVFVRSRQGGPAFASLCDPGIAGVTACACANPPSGPGRGCDNSSGTGGAVLAAAGGTLLSSDTLVFTTSGEKPTALSIVGQWTGTNASGVVFGMGVRCTSGTLKRLYTKTAVGGSISAPSFIAGDPQVSVRSAALGDTILAGQSRWYLVYYRDPIVLGGCPASSTFNATQTGAITWAP